MGSESSRVVDANTRADKCTGVEVQGSGGGLVDTDPAFGPRTGDGAQGPGSGQAGTNPRAGTRTGVKAYVSGGEGADVGRGTGAETLMVSTVAEIIDMLTDPADGEAARLEVGELTITGTSCISSCVVR